MHTVNREVITSKTWESKRKRRNRDQIIFVQSFPALAADMSDVATRELSVDKYVRIA